MYSAKEFCIVSLTNVNLGSFVFSVHCRFKDVGSSRLDRIIPATKSHF